MSLLRHNRQQTARSSGTQVDRPAPTPSTGGLESCAYFDICQRFVSVHMGLREEVFTPTRNCCLCVRCRKLRGEGALAYAIPHGWCRFAIGLSRLDIVERGVLDWPIAYHGTSSESAVEILKQSGGDLLYFGDKLPNGSTLGVVKGHYEDSSRAAYVYVSPSLRYCSSPAYCKRTDFEDRTFLVALQVHIKPGSYTVIGETILPAEEKEVFQIDPHVSNDVLEWRTDRRGRVVVVSGLLVRVVSQVLDVGSRDLSVGRLERKLRLAEAEIKRLTDELQQQKEKNASRGSSSLRTSQLAPEPVAATQPRGEWACLNCQKSIFGPRYHSPDREACDLCVLCWERRQELHLSGLSYELFLPGQAKPSYVIPAPPPRWERQLRNLREMGFGNVAEGRLVDLLEMHAGNLQQVVKAVLTTGRLDEYE